MMEDLEPNIDSLIRIWAPDPKAHPRQFEAMRKLAELKGENGETLASILQANGVTSAEITPPFRRGYYMADEFRDYELFAAPFGLDLTVEGKAIRAAIKTATELFGSFNLPFSRKYEFQDYIAENGFSVLSSMTIKRAGAL